MRGIQHCFNVYKDPSTVGYLFYARKYDLDKERCYIGRISWEEYSGLEYKEPTLVLQTGPLAVGTGPAVQELMDDLWRCGVRPTEGAGTAGSMLATHGHLKDLQRIVFGLLKKQGVE